jgi:hypothetical protein
MNRRPARYGYNTIHYWKLEHHLLICLLSLQSKRYVVTNGKNHKVPKMFQTSDIPKTFGL